MMDPFGYRPCPKPNRKRTKRSTDFSPATRKAIIERDGGLCVRCFKKAAHIHHISYRSELTEDVSSKKNGCCLCYSCHELCHRSKEVREELRKWKETILDEEGEYLF